MRRTPPIALLVLMAGTALPAHALEGPMPPKPGATVASADEV